MVNSIYKRKRFDKIKPVSRFEYEQKEIRSKLDIANLYVQLEEIKEALADQGIEVKEESTRKKEALLVLMVEEDRKSVETDLEILKYHERIEAYENGSIYESLRRLFRGYPTFPATKENIDNEKPEEKKVEPKKRTQTEQERMEALIERVEAKGGVSKASKEEKEDLQAILLEIKSEMADSKL